MKIRKILHYLKTRKILWRSIRYNLKPSTISAKLWFHRRKLWYIQAQRLINSLSRCVPIQIAMKILPERLEAARWDGYVNWRTVGVEINKELFVLQQLIHEVGLYGYIKGGKKTLLRKIPMDNIPGMCHAWWSEDYGIIYHPSGPISDICVRRRDLNRYIRKCKKYVKEGLLV